jgi:hypothetical protein
MHMKETRVSKTNKFQIVFFFISPLNITRMIEIALLIY